MAKPFGMMELMARVRTALRHAGQNQPKEKTYSLGSLFVDPERTSSGTGIGMSP